MDLPENKLADFIEDDQKAKWRTVNNHNIFTFTEDEIKMITRNYSTTIGKGAFGVVYLGVLQDGSSVAVKKYICHDLKEGFAKEITVHCQINHRNVVRLLGYCSEENALMMVTEYISRGNLKDLLHGSDDPVSLDTRLGVATDCAEALSYMHSSMYQPVIHGDIKPDNILLDGNLSAKLSDFGISRLLSMDNTQYTMHVIGSRGYMDPEHLETGRVDPKNDVYGFGVVLVELVTRTKVSENGISTGLTRNFTEAMGKGKKKAREMFDTEMVNVRSMKVLDKIGELAAECLRRDIRKRPEMKDVADRLRILRKRAQKLSEEGTIASISSSNSRRVLYSLDMFNRNARRNFVRNGGRELEKVENLRIFTNDELRKITNNYSDVVGQGKFVKVYRGVLEDKTPVAVRKDVAQVRFASFYRPGLFLNNNIIKLLGCCLESDEAMLVYEFAGGGSLYDLILRSGIGGASASFPLGSRLDVAVASADAVAYLHSVHRTSHGSVSSANILLDEDLRPKVSGMLFPRHAASFARDVCRFGVVLLELITGRQTRYISGEVLSLREEFVRVYEEQGSGRAMFDEEIVALAVAADHQGAGVAVAALEEVARLAAECIREDAGARPGMVEVARRLHGIASTVSGSQQTAPPCADS